MATGNINQQPVDPPYGHHIQADPETAARFGAKAAQDMGDADLSAREIAEKQRKAQELAAADQANRRGWSGQKK